MRFSLALVAAVLSASIFASPVPTTREIKSHNSDLFSAAEDIVRANYGSSSPEAIWAAVALGLSAHARDLGMVGLSDDIDLRASRVASRKTDTPMNPLDKWRLLGEKKTANWSTNWRASLRSRGLLIDVDYIRELYDHFFTPEGELREFNDEIESEISSLDPQVSKLWRPDAN